MRRAPRPKAPRAQSPAGTSPPPRQASHSRAAAGPGPARTIPAPRARDPQPRARVAAGSPPRTPAPPWRHRAPGRRSEEHTSELQSHLKLVCRLLLEKKNIGLRAVTLVMHYWGWPIGLALAGRRPFFFNDTATTEIYTLSLHDALPIFATALQA